MPLALWIIIGLIALLAIASMLPFSLCVKGARVEQASLSVSYGGFSCHTKFHWPWKTFGIGMRWDAHGRYIQLFCGNRCLYERERRKKKRRKRKRKGKDRGAISLLRERQLLRQLVRAGLRFSRDLLLCFRRPRLAGDIEVGFGDPAAMGVISGFVYAVSPSGMMLDKLKIRPNYIDATFTGNVSLSTSALPARIIAALIKLIFYLPIRGLLRLLRLRRKAAKEKEVT
jgi:hypothetical protein